MSTYMHGLAEADLAAMVSSFAVETFVDHFDLHAYLDWIGVYSAAATPLLVPPETPFSRALGVEQRHGDVIDQILGQYLALADPDLDPSEMVNLTEDAALDDFYTDLVAAIAAVDTTKAASFTFVPLADRRPVGCRDLRVRAEPGPPRHAPGGARGRRDHRPRGRASPSRGASSSPSSAWSATATPGGSNSWAATSPPCWRSRRCGPAPSPPTRPADLARPSGRQASTCTLRVRSSASRWRAGRWLRSGSVVAARGDRSMRCGGRRGALWRSWRWRWSSVRRRRGR